MNIKQTCPLVALASLFLVAATASAQYPKRGVRLLSNLPLSAFAGPPTVGSAVLSYTSLGGREYAIIGMSNGKHFVEVTNPTSPIIVGFVATPVSSAWQEMAVLNDYLYGVSEHNRMHIIDLTQIDSGTVRFVGEWTHSFLGDDGITTYNYGRSHTIQPSKRLNRLYQNGNQSYDRRYINVLDATDPENPTILGYFKLYDASVSRWIYAHDITVKTYDTGPYAGRELIMMNAGYDGLWILDATVPTNITVIWTSRYLPANTYTHSGSFSPDGKYYFANDEFDEAYGAIGSNTTHVFDVRALSDAAFPTPVYVGQDNHGGNFIDHNSMVQDGKLFVSSYRGGVRIFDFDTPSSLAEAGFFDSYPASDAMDYEGNWGVDGNFPSGNIILSDRQTGLYVLDPSEASGFGAVPISESFARGFKAAGTFGDSRKPDDKLLHYQGLSNGMNATMTLETTMNVTGAGTFNLEARSANSPVQLTVQAFNTLTSKWITLGKPNLGATDSTFTLAIANVAPYINGSSQIQVRFTLRRKARGATGDPGIKIDALNFITN